MALKVKIPPPFKIGLNAGMLEYLHIFRLFIWNQPLFTMDMTFDLTVSFTLPPKVVPPMTDPSLLIPIPPSSILALVPNIIELLCPSSSDLDSNVISPATETALE